MPAVVGGPRRLLQPDGRPALAWSFAAPVRAVSTAVLGGGLGEVSWVLNAEVPLDYDHPDPAEHVGSLAAGFGLAGPGVGLLTAARVDDVATAADEGVVCDATVGISVPTWASAAEGAWSRWEPGTINLVAWVPAPLSDAALVNAVVTATEAKAQALLEAAVPGTGTASDAVVICCPSAEAGAGEPYGGPRSEWGSRLARAAHAAVAAGTARYLARGAVGETAGAGAGGSAGAGAPVLADGGRSGS